MGDARPAAGRRRRSQCAHLDGYDLLPFLKGDQKDSPRKEFVFWNDDGQLCVDAVVEKINGRQPAKGPGR